MDHAAFARVMKQTVPGKESAAFHLFITQGYSRDMCISDARQSQDEHTTCADVSLIRPFRYDRCRIRA